MGVEITAHSRSSVQVLSYSLRNPVRPKHMDHLRRTSCESPSDSPSTRDEDMHAKFESSQKEFNNTMYDYRKRVEELEQLEFETAESNAQIVAGMEAEIVHLREKLRLAEIKAQFLLDQSVKSATVMAASARAALTDWSHADHNDHAETDGSWKAEGKKKKNFF